MEMSTSKISKVHKWHRALSSDEIVNWKENKCDCILCTEAAQQCVQRTAGILRENFNPYDLNDVAKVDEIVKRRR